MMSSTYARRRCPACNTNKWKDYIIGVNDLSMTSDQRIVKGSLQKMICTSCGLVSNKNDLSNQEIEQFYKDDYTLNTGGNEEHLFFTPDGPAPRSEIFADWVTPFIKEDMQTITEIGCGEGNFLTHLVNRFPDKTIRGFDGSSSAVTLAQQKGLNVDQLLIHDETTVLPKSDCFILLGVMEHVEHFSSVIHVLKKSLNPNGSIVLSIPIQDQSECDIFFADHVWHFMSQHFIEALKAEHLKTFFSDINHPIIHGFGLFVCQLEDENAEENKDNNFRESQAHMLSLNDDWSKRLSEANERLKEAPAGRMAAFGASESFTLLFTNTDLQKKKLEFIIDETPSKIGTKKHGIDIVGLDDTRVSSLSTIFITTNPKYHSIVQSKLSQFNLNKVLLLD